MESLTDRIKEVYRDLGSVLDNPEQFGLGERAPSPLVKALTAMREKLKEELIELKRPPSDNLAAELSQDADRPAVACQRQQRTG